MVDGIKRVVGALDDWSQRHRLTRISRRAVSGFLAHEALQYAGSMAYFAVLSLFQLLVLAVVLGSFIIGEGAARAFVVDQVSGGSPIDRETVQGVIDATIESRGSLTIIGFGFLLWSALGVFSAMSAGISRVFENAPRRAFLADKLIGLLLMGTTGILAIASLAIGLITGILVQTASDLMGDLPGGSTFVWLLGLFAPFVLILLAFWVLYKVVPNRPVRWGEVLPGAIVAAILWTILRFGFTWYATSVADYESAFGPLATGVTLLVFLYFASVVVLLGAEFARASALDDEVGIITAADPRLLPVPVPPAPGPAPTAKRGLPRPVMVVGAAALRLLVGRLTKRGEDDD